ncbi:MAG: hypothetical protein E6Q97_17255 [Desulfurellales bacterium]|nr:MAG: hypothetical protein E6Q97_17255 [Desulfurellales bacterium]
MIRSYEYGARTPENQEVILKILDKANRYRNRLAKIEQQRREKTDAVMLEFCPELMSVESERDKLTTKIDELVDQVKGRSTKARKKVPMSREERESLKSMKAERKVLNDRRKELRAVLFAETSELTHRINAIGEWAKEECRQARATCDLYWGTYLLIEGDAEAFRKGPPPRLRRFEGRGRIGVQIQNGLSWDAMCAGEDTRLRLIADGVPPPDAPPRLSAKGVPLPKQKAKRAAMNYTLWMRIGSQDKGKPMWAKIPCIIHRQPPEGTMVKWATLHRNVVGGVHQWRVVFSLENHASAWTKRDVAYGGAVGIDIGYRVLPSGRQRVAIAVGSDGREHSLVLDKGMVDEFDKVKRIQSHRDELFNEAKAWILEYMNEHGEDPWLKSKLEHLDKWKSKRRLQDVIEEWSARSALPGDALVLEKLEHWAFEREPHLWAYERNLDQQLRARRKDIYRNWVVMLRRTYRTAIIEKMDLREAIHDTKRPEEDQEVTATQRRKASQVALSILIQCIKNGGQDVVELDPNATTSTCHYCGKQCEWDHAKNLRHQCEHCGTTWDQDENAARNLLRAGLEAAPAEAERKEWQEIEGAKSKRHAGRMLAKQRRMAEKIATPSESKS